MYQEKIFINSNDVDDHYDIKISTIFKYLQQVSTNHAELIGLGKKDTVDKGMFWVITRFKVEIYKMPKMLETLTVTTHPGDLMAFIFPRFYEIYNEKGELVIAGSSDWVLLDSETHKVKMKPFGDGYTFKGEKDPKDIPLPAKIIYEEPLSLIEERKVRYSEIDLNGHLNNTQYINYIIDTHDINFYKKYRVSSILVNYDKEIKNEDIVKISSNNEFPEIVMGETNGAHAFSAKIEYIERKD